MRLGAVGRLAVALLVVSLFAATCDGDDEPQTGRSPPPHSMAPTSSTVSVPGCENASEVVTDPDSRRPGVVSGDVDGDGSDDSVSIAIDEEAESPCEVFLVVETNFGTQAISLQLDGVVLEFDLPSFNSLVELDPRPGFEIVVNLIQGASTSFAGVYAVTGDGIEMVSLPQTSDTFEDLFAFGGSVGHIDGADCVEGDRVVVSGAVPTGSSGKRYRVKRRFLRFEGTDLVLDSADKVTTPASKLNKFPEFSGPLFGSCRTG